MLTFQTVYSYLFISIRVFYIDANKWGNSIIFDDVYSLLLMYHKNATFTKMLLA